MACADDFSQLNEQVAQVLDKFPLGINLHAFLKVFKQSNKTPLRPESFGCQNINDLLQHCSCCLIEERGNREVVVLVARPPQSAKKSCDDHLADSSGKTEKPTTKPKKEDSVRVEGLEAEPPASSAPQEKSPEKGSMPRDNRPSHYYASGPPMPYPQGNPFNRAPSHMVQRYQAPHPQHQHYQPPQPLRPHFSTQQLNDSAEDCISRIASSKKFVSVPAIQSHLLRDLEVLTVRELGLRAIDEIPVVRDHIRAQCKVSTYIQAFVKVRSIGTLYELEQNLSNFVNNNQDFEQLNLGPLVQQPLVSEYFKMPMDAAIPQLTTADVLEGLRDHLTISQQWTSRDTKVEDFLEFLCKKLKLKDPFYLGLRMTSMALAIGVLKKAQRECGQALRTSLGVMKSCTEADLERAYKHFKETLLCEETRTVQVRRTYLQMPSTKAVLQTFMQQALLLCKSVVRLADLCEIEKRSRRELHKQTTILEQFLGCLDSSRTLELLFAIAINCSRDDIRAEIKDLLDLYEISVNPADSQDSQSADKADSVKTVRPSIGSVEKEFKTYLERCMNSASLTLTHLNNIERKLLEHFECKSFNSLTNSTFLEFLHDNKGVHKLLEECGGYSLGSSASSRKHRLSSYLPCSSDLFAFVQQSQALDQLLSLERALCYHYGAHDVSDLNHGNMANLAKVASHQTRSAQDAVFYEAALMAKSCQDLYQSTGDVGRLGHRVRAEALCCLQNCPLLQDMAEWSQWALVFEAEFGSLKEFLLKYGGTKITPVKVNNVDMQLTTSFLALEVRPGKLVRLCSDSSNEHFKSCAERLDPRGTAGHLASLIAINRGIQNAPLALLGNHMRAALFETVENKSSAPGGPGLQQRPQSTTAVSFVLDCLQLLPLSMAQASANKVFLEPLSQVVGMSSSKELLLQAAQHSSQLHTLGILLGVSEWNTKFLERFHFPDQCMTQAETVDFGNGPCVILSESESEEEEEEEEEEGEEEDIFEIPVDGEGKPEEADVAVNKKATPPITPLPLEEREDEIGYEEKFSDKQSFIERIRREEFGIGLTLTAEFQAVFEKNQARLGRSLQRLAHDLYSKDTHFVLELIQNADDNKYAEQLLRSDSAVKPCLSFVVSETAVTITNNELGFLEQHVKAICDVGCSTKPKHQMGYIGQKGIGFKSVFRVSDEPEIISNGFHFKFDKGSSDMGYILPHWVDEDEDNRHHEGTKIILPFKEASSLANRSRFHDLHANLLLFLNRLRKITLTIEPSAQTERVHRSMERKDVGGNMVEISHENVVDQWLVIKKRLEASALTKSENVEATEIALAFPIQSKEQISAKILPEKQLVFAFLPLRSYGFRFIVQGDFDLPSSREDVDHDSVWNQWLRSSIHQVFIEALNTFKTHKAFDAIEGVSRFLQFVPLEDEVLDFFRSVASDIIGRLKRTQCLPAAPINNDVQWRLPSQLVAVRDSLLRTVISPQMLYDCLGLHYLHPAVLPFLSPALSRTLGVQSLNAQQLMDIGQALVKQMSDSGDMDLAKVAHWLACMHNVLDDFDVDDSVMDKLKQLPIIPASDGRLVSTSQGNLFFPITHDPAAKNARKSSVMMLLEQSVCSVNPALLSCIADDRLIHSRVWRLLEMLGIRKHTPIDLIHHHIVPLLNDHEHVSNDLLVAAVIYICEQWEKDANVISIDDLHKCIVLKTNHGMKRPFHTPVHFSPAFRSSTEMPNLLEEFPGYDWTLLDDGYLQSHTKAALRLKFFSAMGVCSFLSFQAEEKTLTQKDMRQSAWSSLLPVLPECEAFVIRDWTCESLEHLIQRHDHREMKNLFQRLAQFWDNDFCKYAVTEVHNTQGVVLKSGVTTSFAQLLMLSEWLPGFREEYEFEEGGMSCEMKKMCCVGKDLFLNVEAVKEVYASHASYMDVTLTQSTTFTNFLGIQALVNPTDLSAALVAWAARLAMSPGTPASFISSLHHMRHVYTYLHENLRPKELLDLFENHPVIFTGFSDQYSKVIHGNFLSMAEVRWDDPTRLFRKYLSDVPLTERSQLCRYTLCVIYEGFNKLFQAVLPIQKEPALHDYLQLLKHICQVHRQQDVLPDVLTLYARISTMLGNMPPHERPMSVLSDALTQYACIPTHGACFVSLSDIPMIADDHSLQLLFKMPDGLYQPGVHFIETEQHYASKPKFYGIEELMCELGVAKLSECVVIETIPQQSFTDPQLQSHVAGIIESIRRLLFHCHSTLYGHFVSTGIVQCLHRLHFAQVLSLEMVYRLRHLPDLRPVLQNESCFLNRDGFWLLRSEASDGPRAQLKINRALATFFSHGNNQAFKDIKNMLNEMIGGVDDMEKFCSEQDLKPLPDHEPLWVIPQPRDNIPPPPPPPAPQQQQRKQPEGAADEMPLQAPDTRSSSGGIKSWPPRSASMTPLIADGTVAAPPPSHRWPMPPEHMAHPLAGFQGSSSGNSAPPSDNHVSEASSSNPATPPVSSYASLCADDPRRAYLVQSQSGGEGSSAAVSSPIHEMAPHLTGEMSIRKRTSTGHLIPDDGVKRPRPFVFQDAPHWLLDVDDPKSLYADLSIDTLPPLDVSIADNDDRHKVAMWGELLVKSYLESEMAKNDSCIRHVQWTSETDSPTAPYDFRIQVETEPLKFEDIFIEVKTTTSGQKAFCEFSIPELSFALEKGPHFHLYRVFNAGDAGKVKLSKIENVEAKLTTKQIKVCLIV